MTLNISNSTFVEILDPIPLEQIGWYCRVLSENDYSTIIAEIVRFKELSFQKDKNGFGGGSITMDLDDPVFSAPLPAGQTVALLDQEAIWQIYEDGILRGEFFAEDVFEEKVKDGVRNVTISGRGIGSVLQWAIHLPFAYPLDLTTEREVVGSSMMNAWIGLLWEAQTRGNLTWVTETFDYAVDSRGVPWPDNDDFGITAGVSLYDLLNDYCDQLGAIWKMLPGFQIWVEQSNGNDRTEEIVFHIGHTQQVQNKKRSRRDIANKLYVYSERKNGAHVTEAADLASRTKWRTREQWVEANNAGATARNRIGQATLESVGKEMVSREITVPYDTPGMRLFVDYDVNDWVTVEADTNDTDDTEMQILTATVTVNSDGVVGLELTLGTRFDAKLVQIQKLLEKQQQGTSSGSTANAAPTKAVSTRSAIYSSKIGDMSNVDTTTVIQGDTFVYNSTTQVFETAPLPSAAVVDVDPPVSPSTGDIWVDFDGAMSPVTVGEIHDAAWTPYGTPTWAEEFNGSALAGAWVRADAAGQTGHVIYTQAAGALSIYHTTSVDGSGVMHALLQPIGPAWAIGDAIVAGVRFLGAYATNYTMHGPCLTNGTVHGTSNLVHAQTYSNSSNAGPGILRANAHPGMQGDTGGGHATQMNPTNGLWFTRLVMTAANTWRADASSDGVSWWIGPSALTYTMTPTHMGFAISNWSTAMQSVVSVELLRRYAGVS